MKTLRERVLQQYEVDLFTRNTINGFFKEHRFLSNFHIQDIEYRGYIWPTNEHAFQAMKSEDEEFWKKILSNPSPSVARKLGQEVKMRDGWLTSYRLTVMYEINKIKFQVPELKQKLLATGNIPLIENNWWNCTYWGICNGIGENHLGKILMQIRGELQ